jgi:two-component system sensor kinase FixL
MPWATITWSMIASACLTLATIYFLVWYKNRAARAHLFFSVAALSTMGWAFCELWMVKALTVGQQTAAIRLAQVPMFFLLVSITWFVRNYMGAGRLWLAWIIVVLRGLYVLPNFVMGHNPSFSEMASPHRIQFLGETVSLTGGTPNPFLLVGQFGVLLVLLFVVDASVTIWRRGDRRKPLVIGGSVVFFLTFGLWQSVLVIWAGLEAPMMVSPFFLTFVAVMGYELSHDVLRASQLVQELQTSEAGLRESEARMSLAVEAGDFGIWIWDLARNELWASDSWRTLFGFSPAEPLAFDGVMQRVHPDDRDTLRQTQASAIAGSNGGRYETEYRVLMPDGAIRWVSSRGRVEGDAGRPLRVRGASREVTARKQAEQEALMLRYEIAHAGRVSMMGQLASGLAHEINQPLASILRNAEAAELFLRDPSPDLDEIRAILSDIRADDERAGHVIERMRSLLKRQTLDARCLDVGSLVGDVAALVRVDAASRDVKLDMEVPGGLPPVLGDRVHLQQVLLNLVLNGMDALNGGIREQRRVTMTARLNRGRTIEIIVGDAGPGIPTDMLARVFDPFVTSKPHGMGMGLAISRTIVEAHGGRIWAENKAGGGAAFRFTLPIAEEAIAS